MGRTAQGWDDLDVASLSRETLRGYVLEEILAWLIRNTGYRLLVDKSQDPERLENRHNGLGLRGRGGTHQVDVLGELAWIPAFTFPLRLIVEAKARKARTGIGDVRNAVGVVSDVNQSFTSAGPGQSALEQRFSYRYALFSTSGFSAPAAEYAVAHQISLVDLSGPDFAEITEVAESVTEALWADGPPRRGDGFLRRLRTHMRVELGIWPPEVPTPRKIETDTDTNRPWQSVGEILRTRLGTIRELFVGMANGPFLLLLRARDPERLIRSLDVHPVRNVSIHWSEGVGRGTRWRIAIPDAGDQLELNFAIPRPVGEWVFDPRGNARRRAMQFKDRFLSTITIYRHVDGRDRLYRLRFSRDQVVEF